MRSPPFEVHGRQGRRVTNRSGAEHLATKKFKVEDFARMVPFRPALKRVIKMRNDSRSAEALRFPNECGGSTSAESPKRDVSKLTGWRVCGLGQRGAGRAGSIAAVCNCVRCSHFAATNIAWEKSL